MEQPQEINFGSNNQSRLQTSKNSTYVNNGTRNKKKIQTTLQEGLAGNIFN